MAKTQKQSKKKSKKGFTGINSAGLVILACFIIAVLIYQYVFGNPANFINNDPNNQPLTGNLLGTIYKGGVVVPIIQTLLLTVIALSIERYFAIRNAEGKGKLVKFVVKIKEALSKGDIEAAKAVCDQQKGSVGNVMKAGLHRYKEMITNNELSTEQKVMAIQKEVEEATSLELPMLEKNLVFLSTIASIATLLGLLGTVLGMIRAFSNLGADSGGSGAAAQLSVGISEALYNTALGIGTSAFAIIFYNIFTTKIDGITYGIDESGFTLTQTFASLYR